MQHLALTALLTAALSLAACDNRPRGDETSGDDGTESSGPLTPNPEQPVSIIRPDVEPPEPEPTPLQPLALTIAFPEGGDEFDQRAKAKLEKLLGSQQVAKGGQITLRGHSDAGGADAANLRVSRVRAERVRDWLVEKGIDPSRITVIAFGEQNPREPNAMPDGSPNEAGRSANRRVEVEVSLHSPDAPPIMEDAQNRSSG